MLNKPLIIDGHLDLSMNALEWNRDLRWNVQDIRLSEERMPISLTGQKEQ
jgi:membrane dipeptidase